MQEKNYIGATEENNDPFLQPEKMSDEFMKWHLRGFPFDGVLHRFNAPDKGDYHNHPFSFTSTILYGGYVEEIMIYNTTKRRKWCNYTVTRLPGESFLVGANTIHKIVKLLKPECYTIILPEQKVQEPGFFRFDHGQAKYRRHDQTEWVEWKPVKLNLSI